MTQNPQKAVLSEGTGGPSFCLSEREKRQRSRTMGMLGICQREQNIDVQKKHFLDSLRFPNLLNQLFCNDIIPCSELEKSMLPHLIEVRR